MGGADHETAAEEIARVMQNPPYARSDPPTARAPRCTLTGSGLCRREEAIVLSLSASECTTVRNANRALATKILDAERAHVAATVSMAGAMVQSAPQAAAAVAPRAAGAASGRGKLTGPPKTDAELMARLRASTRANTVQSMVDTGPGTGRARRARQRVERGPGTGSGAHRAGAAPDVPSRLHSFYKSALRLRRASAEAVAAAQGGAARSVLSPSPVVVLFLRDAERMAAPALQRLLLVWSRCGVRVRGGRQRCARLPLIPSLSPVRSWSHPVLLSSQPRRRWQRCLHACRACCWSERGCARSLCRSVRSGEVFWGTHTHALTHAITVA